MKQLKEYKYLFLLFFSICFTVSCDREEVKTNDDSVIIESPDYADITEFNDSVISIPEGKGVLILKISSENKWNVSLEDDVEWCILSDESGSDYTELRLAFNENEYNVERMADIKFSVQNNEEKIVSTIKQKAQNTYFTFEDCEDNKLIFASSQSRKSLVMQTNAFEWEARILDENEESVDWCQLVDYVGSGDTAHEIIVQSNDTPGQRVAYLVIASNGQEYERVEIIQEANTNDFVDGGLLVEGFDTDNLSLVISGVAIEETQSPTFDLTLSPNSDFSMDFDEIANVTATRDGENWKIDISNIESKYIGDVYAKVKIVAVDKSGEISCDDSFPILFAGGDGTEATPFEVSCERHLKNISKVTQNGKFFKQMGDITLTTDNSFEPLCSGGFSSMFDGDNKSISSLKIDFSGRDNVGLFAKISHDGVVKNVNLFNIDIDANQNVGGIAGICEGCVDNCTVSGTINASGNVGGIIGTLTVSVSGVGAPIISNNTNEVDVTSSGTNIAGIVGYIAKASVVGGFTVKRCKNFGRISGEGTNVGGIVGNVDKLATISESFNSKEIQGGSIVGGVVGYTNGQANIMDSYNTGTIKGKNASGILSQSNNKNTTISSCYNIGGVEQGYSLYNTTNSNKKIMLTDCYYLNSISLGGVNGNNYAAGSTFYEKTSDEMKNGTAFANWSTDIWTFESGKYPTLKNTPEDN